MQQSSGTKIRLIATALIILLGPAFFWYLVTRGKNNYVTLKILGPVNVVTVNGKTDTVYHRLGPFSFTDQSGRIISEENFRNKIYVAAFFYTACKSVCPEIIYGLQDVAYEFKDDSTLKIISFSVFPDHDSVPVLAAYAKQYHADPHRWYFATGYNKEQVYKLAQEDYLLPVQTIGNKPADFIHSDKLMLMDPDKRIRGIYKGTDAWEIKRLKEEIKVLKFEYRKTLK